MACADVAKARTKTREINLIILSSLIHKEIDELAATPERSIPMGRVAAPQLQIASD
jgi:hypothetical protein